MRNITITTRRASTLFAIIVLTALAVALSLIGAVPNAAPAAVSAAVPAQASVDYDSDNDNLIEISGHAQLHAINHDLDGNGAPTSGGATAYNDAFPNAASGMGCASTCIGYELTADIDLDTDGDGNIGSDTDDAYNNAGAGWDPIGDFNNRYTGVLHGNGFTITNLYINRATTSYMGLFSLIGIGARVEALNITAANITGNNYVGVLASYNIGEVVAVHTAGSVTASSGSYAGGIVANQTAAGSIHSSYSNATVIGQANVGGLVGYAAAGTSADIINSYSTGAVRRSSGTATTIGGLIGAVATGFAASASYYDSTTSGCVTGGTAGCTTSAGGTGVSARTTAQLQAPVGYTGIYAAWNANLDGVTGADDPWYFGTTSQYPVLKYGKTDYDIDNDRYIEVSNLAQLDAIRHDRTGDGNPASGGAAAYNAAFPLRFAGAGGRMGCPNSGCTGYELTQSLDFDENGDGRITSADSTYWNNGEGWDPIASDTPSAQASRYQGDFNGNGFTINNMFINRAGDDIGLFGGIHSTTRIESLGVTNANITGRHYIGILVGASYGAVVACYTTGSATSTITSGLTDTGGLVGLLNTATPPASIHSSYSTASVNSADYVGGLVGRSLNSAITNSYSTGRVTRTSGTGPYIGGLIGYGSGNTITATYYDTDTSGCVTGGANGCTGSNGGTPKTTAELQNPTGYTGIYATWSANLDGVAGGDAPWAFGTSSDYPTLVYHLTVDYDEDNDNLIDVANLAQLNAMRYDRNGNGANEASGAYQVSASDWAIHSSAFPRQVAGMGCLATCAGYELVASLDFDTNGDGSVTVAGDDYWNGGAGWTPIGATGSLWGATFRGNGHTINNLFINTPANDDLGLFGSSASRIETLGVTNAYVRGDEFLGILVGSSYGEIVACYTTGAVTGSRRIGGIVGEQVLTTAHTRSVYSTASVSGEQHVGGLVGRLRGGVTHSYSTGRVVRSSGTATTIGGLTGSASSGTATASYYDTSASGCIAGGSAGCTTSAVGTGKTTRELQTVTGYTTGSIYADWNANLDGESGNDDPWDFGNNMQYPMLDYQGMNVIPQNSQAMGIADNWNAPVVGERINVSLTPDEMPNRAIVPGTSYRVPWSWERSADGAVWTAIPGTGDGSSLPTYEYTPFDDPDPMVEDDVGKYIRAKVQLADGSFATTRALGGRVVATSGATAGAEIPFVSGNTAPYVGLEIVASNPLPADAVDARFGWQRCPNTTAPHTDCEYVSGLPGVWWIRYTPRAADVGSYLRMYAYYESGGVWIRRVTPFTLSVVAQP